MSDHASYDFPPGAFSPRAAGMVPDETSGPASEALSPTPLAPPHETPAAPLSPTHRHTGTPTLQHLKTGALRLAYVQRARALRASGATWETISSKLGTPLPTIYKWTNRVAHIPEPTAEDLAPRLGLCGRRAEFLPSRDELACVREIYLRLSESTVRGRGLGSSKVTAYRLAAKSDDPRISEGFRAAVLQRVRKTIPATLSRLLDTPSSVLARARDDSSTMTTYISTPRGLTYINARGDEVPLRAGSIFESDDGTVNFPVCVPWPYGGDPCADKFGVKVGRFQLLPIIDRRTRFCLQYHFVIRVKASYRGEDIVALFGSCFIEIGLPEALCLERGSWECNLVRAALDMLPQLGRIRAWEPKQKNAVENFFDRLWTPLSLLPGDVGRHRGEHADNTELLMRAQAGRIDPRLHFLTVDQATKGIASAVSFINSEPIESTKWGRWIPQKMWEEQTDGGAALTRLPQDMQLFFSREQRVWTVRAGCLGGRVATPALEFPVYFQTPELWEFEGCRVKVFFDPFADPCLGTLVLEDEWRGYKPGHIIARNIPSLDLPPQAVLAADWQRTDELERGLAIRKAMAKAVRTEKWTWLGRRTSEARDGLGNVTVVGRGYAEPSPGRASSKRALPEPPTTNQRARFAEQAALARSLNQLTAR